MHEISSNISGNYHINESSVENSAKTETSDNKNVKEAGLSAIKNLQTDQAEDKTKTLAAHAITPRVINTLEDYKSCSVTKEQSEGIYESLKPGGPLRELLKGTKGEDVFDKRGYIMPEHDEVLPTGKVLFRGEQAAIALYTSDAYKLLNGVLASDRQQRKQFYEAQGIPTEDRSKLEEEALKFVETIASGLNKIPKKEEPLFRGDYYAITMLEQMKNGQFREVNQRFKSTSDGPMTCVHWAMEGAEKAGHGFVPVLFMFEGKSAADIQKYSTFPDESERLYLPLEEFHCEGTQGQEPEVASFKELMEKNEAAKAQYNEDDDQDQFYRNYTESLDIAKRTEGKGSIVKVEISEGQFAYVVKLMEGTAKA